MHEQVLQFFRAVRRMRAYQTSFFRSRSNSDLVAAKKAEKFVDDAVRGFFSALPAQLAQDKDNDLPF